MNINKHHRLELGNIYIDVIRKNIKNVHLSVHPPLGRVTVSAPLQMDIEAIRFFSISKLSWIRKQQTKIKKEKPQEIILP